MEINKDFKLTIKIGAGWKYLTALQSNVFDRAIKTLENAKTRDKRLSTSMFIKAIEINYNTLSRVLGYLVALRIFRNEQYGRVVLYSLIGGWRSRLKQVTKRRTNQRVC